MFAEELAKLSLFQDLRAEHLNLLAPLIQPVRFRAGETIFTEGQEANAFYILQAGEVILRFHPDDGGSLDLVTLRSSDVFGWSAVLGRVHYTSSAICLTEVVALSLQGNDLRRLRRIDPEFGGWLFEHLAQVVANRFEDMRAQTAELRHARVAVEHPDTKPNPLLGNPVADDAWKSLHHPTPAQPKPMPRPQAPRRPRSLAKRGTRF
jgi:CRP-like cAMP-binding protein